MFGNDFYTVVLYLLAQVNVKIEGVDYSFRFQPEIVSVVSLAKQFCVEHGGQFGVTVETLDNCVVPISNRLQKEVDEDRLVSDSTNDNAFGQNIATADESSGARMLKPLVVSNFVI